MRSPMLNLKGVSKSFIMHLQAGTRLTVVENVSFEVYPGECVALVGPSGIGKSSLMKMIYGNYRCDAGSIRVATGNDFVDVATATPRQILRLRRHGLGYVSQFLRVIPRISTLDIVIAAADDLSKDAARAKAETLLRRLSVAPHMWPLAPATFSGGEQQRINIARSFISRHPVLLLDEPTASLDPDNRTVVVELIAEKKRQGCAILTICHDDDVRGRIADRFVDVSQFAGAVQQRSGGNGIA